MNGLEDGYYKIERDEQTGEEIIEFVPVSSSDPDSIMLCFIVVTALSAGVLFGVILFVASLIIEPAGIMELVSN